MLSFAKLEFKNNLCYYIQEIHNNPAVSFAMFLDKRINLKDFTYYSIFQILGGIIATTVIWMILNTLKSDITFTYGQNTQGDLNIFGTLLTEIILTSIFVFVILSVTKTKFIAPNISVIIIGLTLTMVHLIGIPLTGTSVNPARSIAPAIFSGGEALKSLWIFIIAPIVGAAFAVAIHKYLDNDGH